MYIFEAVVLGFVQGLTEFLPISSSAHLTLLPKVLGWEAALLNSLAFDVALHFGTLIAVLLFFWADILKISTAWTASLFRPERRREPDARLGWYIILGTLPAVVAAVWFQDAIETTFRTPWVVAVWLIGFGLVMAAAEAFTQKERDMETMRWPESLVIGLAQALALMPGVSRSGSTITAGLLMRFRREEAARFAFLLSIPAIVGAVVFSLKALLASALDQSVYVLLAGTVVAALTGYGCIKFLLAYLRRRSLYIFVVYRIILGCFIIVWSLKAAR